ncbi:MAG: tetratricopeptide repeat protein, partial [Ignavibacteriaceae bacterium]|nr:tetratricopeptide repeat protein [Ignavibacteriaceae bacterium]
SDYEIAKINFLTFVSSKHKSDLIHEAYLYLVKIEVALENYDIALDFAKRAEPVYFDYWEFNYLLAKIYYKLGMVGHAIKPIEKSIQQNKKQAELFELAGKIYLKAGDFIKAEKKYLKFIEISSDTSPEIYVELAQVCLKANKANDALKYFEMAIELDPENRYALQGKKNAKLILNKNAVSDG